jgi:hypothetical protein
MSDKYVVKDVYGKQMLGPTSKTGATQYARMIRAQTGNKVRVEKTQSNPRMSDKYVVKDVYGKQMLGPTSKTGATQYARMIRAQTGNKVRVEKTQSNPARKSVSLKNFTGTVTRKPDGSVVVREKRKTAKRKR